MFIFVLRVLYKTNTLNEYTLKSHSHTQAFILNAEIYSGSQIGSWLCNTSDYLLCSWSPLLLKSTITSPNPSSLWEVKLLILD